MLTRAHSSGDKCGPLPGALHFVFGRDDVMVTFLEDDPSWWELLRRGRCHVAPGFGSLWQCSLGVQQLGWMAKWLSGSRSELIKFVIESSKAARSLTAHWGGLALVFGTMRMALSCNPWRGFASCHQTMFQARFSH